MAEDAADHLKSLHTRAVDARKGYEEALDQAEGKGLTPLFRRLVALHASHAEELAADLAQLGEATDSGGSFMSTIHSTIMDIRAMFGGLDASVLPGLIDGETRNLARYDEALQVPDMPANAREHLLKQRAELASALDGMRALRAEAA